MFLPIDDLRSFVDPRAGRRVRNRSVRARSTVRLVAGHAVSPGGRRVLFQPGGARFGLDGSADRLGHLLAPREGHGVESGTQLSGRSPMRLPAPAPCSRTRGESSRVRSSSTSSPNPTRQRLTRLLVQADVVHAAIGLRARLERRAVHRADHALLARCAQRPSRDRRELRQPRRHRWPCRRAPPRSVLGSEPSRPSARR